MGVPPQGLSVHRLQATLTRGEERISLGGTPLQWMLALEEKGAPSVEISELLLAAQNWSPLESGWGWLGRSHGVYLSRGTRPRQSPPLSLRERFPKDWARWFDLLLAAGGCCGPDEVGEEAVYALLQPDAGPWTPLGANKTEEEAVGIWESSGGRIEPLFGPGQGYLVPSEVLGSSLGWPARRFVQVVGRASPRQTGKLHIIQRDPEGLPLEENLLVGWVRSPDADAPAKEGRRAFLGAWFDERWWDEDRFPSERIEHLLTGVAGEIFEGYEHEAFRVPESPTRWDGAFGRPTDWGFLRQLATGRKGGKILGVMGLPSAFHLSVLSARKNHAREDSNLQPRP